VQNIVFVRNLLTAQQTTNFLNFFTLSALSAICTEQTNPKVNYCPEHEELLSQHTDTTTTASPIIIDENKTFNARDINSLDLNFSMSDIHSDITVFE